jgi:hypothetical protein
MYVLVRARPGPGHVLARMEAAGPHHWHVSLRFPPGTYRYRYYADLGGAFVYESPVDVEDGPVAMRRFDAEFVVGDQSSAPGSAVEYAFGRTA